MLLPESLFEKFGRVYRPGEIIFCEYEPGSDVFFIQEGRVKLIKTLGNSQKTLDVLSRGSFFGEMAFLEQAPRSATAIAIDRVRVLTFNRESFDTLLKSLPQLVWNLLVVFSTRIYDAKRRLQILHQEDLEARVADVFVMLVEKEPDYSKTGRFTLQNTTAEDIANWCAQPVETVKPIIQKFANTGRLELFSDHIVITNINDFSRLIATRKKFL